MSSDYEPGFSTTDQPKIPAGYPAPGEATKPRNEYREMVRTHKVKTLKQRRKAERLNRRKGRQS